MKIQGENLNFEGMKALPEFSKMTILEVIQYLGRHRAEIDILTLVAAVNDLKALEGDNLEEQIYAILERDSLYFAEYPWQTRNNITLPTLGKWVVEREYADKAKKNRNTIGNAGRYALKKLNKGEYSPLLACVLYKEGSKDKRVVINNPIEEKDWK